MNKEQRKKLECWLDQLTDTSSAIREMAEEEQEKADNMPESLQCSERHERLEYAAETLSQLADDIENAVDEARGELEI